MWRSWNTSVASCSALQTRLRTKWVLNNHSNLSSVGTWLQKEEAGRGMGTCGIPLRAVHTTLLAGSHSYPIILLGLITGINLKKKKKKVHYVCCVYVERNTDTVHIHQCLEDVLCVCKWKTRSYHMKCNFYLIKLFFYFIKTCLSTL